MLTAAYKRNSNMAFSSVLQMYLDWANSLLCEHGIVVNELKEFQDGRIFSLLIHNLTGTQLFPAAEDCNDDDISSTDRVQTILDYLTGLGIKLKITASGVLKGELKSILDVIWAIILHFTIHSPDTPVQQKTVRNGKKQLLQWCSSQLGQASIDAGKGLTHCFEKNNKLAELIGQFCTSSSVGPETYVSNLTSALIAAEDTFGISKSLLSPADVIRGTVEEHSLTIYLALLRRKVTQLGPQTDRSAEISGESITPVGLPEGLTQETSNSRIPVSRAMLTQQQSKDPDAASGIPRSSSSRKRHQEATEEQKQPSTVPAPGNKAPSKMHSGIPVRKTQKLSSLKPVQTSTPVSKPRKVTSAESPVADPVQSSRVYPRETVRKKTGTALQFGDDDGNDDDVVDGVEADGAGHQEGESMIREMWTDTDKDADIQDVSVPGTGRVLLDVFDIAEDDGEVKEGIQQDADGCFFERDSEALEYPKVEGNKGDGRGHSLAEPASQQCEEASKMGRDSSVTELQDPSPRDKESVGQMSNLHYHKNDSCSSSEQSEKVERTTGHGDRGTEDSVQRNPSKPVKLPIREDGDGQRVMAELVAGSREATGTGKGKGKLSGRGREASKERESPTKDVGSFSQDEESLHKRGEELSLLLPKGLSGRHGDELETMLEAIASESKQLRQELNDAKAREDFLTKKLNERFSSQEEEVINRLVGELEMLRRENQRLFQELAVARETGAEDHKRCEKLQAAVERLEMDVERLTAENFRLKFAADTGYEVTGDDLMAAMEDGDVGFQSLPSPGKSNTSRGSVEAVPSPIIDAQTDHETKLLAMKAETSSMRKLQELLTKAHTENRKLRAEQQERRRSADLQEEASKVKADLQNEVSKVRADLDQARTTAESLCEENAGLRKEIESGRATMAELRQRCSDLEEMVKRKVAAERDLQIDQERKLPASLKDEMYSGRILDKPADERESSGNGKPMSVNDSYSGMMGSPPPGAECSVMSGINTSHPQHNKYGLSLDVRSPTEGKHSRRGSTDLSLTLDKVAGYEVKTKMDGKKAKNCQNVLNGAVQKSENTCFGGKNDQLTLQMGSRTGDNEATNRKKESVEESHSIFGTSPEAVVDWKYLAVSPEPANEMRSIKQYISPTLETGTSCTSEVESETESRASDIFTSGSVSSPVGRTMLGQDRERKPSLGGLIVERAQKSPLSSSQQHLPVVQLEPEVKDNTLINESYITTSPDYVTADESSVGCRKLLGKDGSETDASTSRERLHSADGLTPYYTPMVQRTKMQFSSLTSSLKSLKSISRKAREDIESETINAVSDIGQRTSIDEATVPTLEKERKWIQQELGRIRLDQNIPGDRYPDLGIDSYGERNHTIGESSFPGDDFKFMPQRRYVPRWRKFQFRNRRSKTSETVHLSSSTPSDLHLVSDLRQSSPDPTYRIMDSSELSRVHFGVRRGMSSYGTSPNAHPAPQQPSHTSRPIPSRPSDRRDVSPSRCSSDELSDEYKPLPSELREPRRLAEGSPVKRDQKSDQSRSKNLYVKGDTREQSGGVPALQETKKDDSIDKNTLLRSIQKLDIPQKTVALSADVPAVSEAISGKSYSSPLQNGYNVPPSQEAVQKSNMTHMSNVQRDDCLSHSKETSISGEIMKSLTQDYLGALADKVIQEADSGVLLTTDLDPKKILSLSVYQHKLLSLDEQTYANSLIEKYMEKMS